LLYKTISAETGAHAAAALWSRKAFRGPDGWMVGKKTAPKRGKRTPIGDRVTFIAMMDKEVIADIKQVAIEEHRAAWDVMEQAAREFLKRRKSRRTP
jgi:hypothetical protein